MAFGIGLATVYGVVPGALATMAGPVMTVVLNALTRVGRRRVEHAAETLLDAADEAELPVAKFFERAVADDRRHELFTRAMSIAQDTALRDKRRALGRALAAGVMGDDAQIDEELLFMRAVEDIDEMHIRLLARMANTYPPGVGPGWSARKIAEADPGLANGAPTLLGTLQVHGLVEEVVRNRPIQGEGATQAFYNITNQGRDFLNRLAEDPDVSLTARSAHDLTGAVHGLRPLTAEIASSRSPARAVLEPFDPCAIYATDRAPPRRAPRPTPIPGLGPVGDTLKSTMPPVAEYTKPAVVHF